MITGQSTDVDDLPGQAWHDIEAALDELAARARGLVAHPEPRVSTAVDCRYRGQSHELRVGDLADFPAEHRRHNGYDRPGHPVEVVALRATARRHSPLDPTTLRTRARPPMEGPAVVVEDDTTIWVPAGWRGEPGPAGTLILTEADR